MGQNGPMSDRTENGAGPLRYSPLIAIIEEELMDFPDVKRVIYAVNPLSEVVCQIRFPRILAIDERIPADFQRMLGAEYPFVETREIVQFSLNLANDQPAGKRVHYDFQPEDRSVTVTLCSEFLAITTQRYERWEKFEAHVGRALDALLACYTVPIFTRIGLRYVDTVRKASLNLPTDAKWKDLIRISALGLLAEDDVPVSSVVEMSGATVLQLDNGGKGLFRTFFGPIQPDDELAFVIDSDLYQDQPVKGPSDALALLQQFNKCAGRAFRWFITDQLHDAMGPVGI